MSKQRLTNLSLLSVVSCLLVICCHIRVNFWKPADELYWYAELLLSIISGLAVPWFFMSSGANLMGYLKKYSTANYFSKRFGKILIPYVAWTVVYLLFEAAMGLYEIKSLRSIFEPFVDNSVNGTFWYIRSLLGIYLCIPFFSIILTTAPDEKSHDRRAWMLLLISIVETLGLKVIRCDLPNFMGNFSLPLGSGYFVFCIAGYVLMHCNIPRFGKILIYLLGIGSAIVEYIGTSKYSIPTGKLDLRYNEYLSFPVLFLAGAGFLFFLDFAPLRLDGAPRIAAVVECIAGLTFGIYMVHYLVILIMDKWAPLIGISIHSTGWIPGRAIICFIVSSGIIYVLKKIPGVRQILVP